MHILTCLGSPRKRGNTAALLDLVERAVGAEHRVERINLIDEDLHGCLGCSACQKDWDAPACVQHDGTLAILKRIVAADAVVYATPLYAWDYSGQLKLLMDRHFCLTKWNAPEAPRSLMAGKRCALLVTCADPVANNADLLPILFQRQMDCARCASAGTFVLPNCTTPDQLPAEAQELALELARAVTVA